MCKESSMFIVVLLNIPVTNFRAKMEVFCNIV